MLHWSSTPSAKQLCQGFHPSSYAHNVNNQPVSVNPKQLIQDIKPGEDGGRTSWYPEPHHLFTRVKDGNVEKIKGTFRSSECFRIANASTYTNDMCSACASIPALQSFKKRILRRTESRNSAGERGLASIHNDFLNSTELVKKCCWLRIITRRIL